MRSILVLLAACACASSARIPVTGEGAAACNDFDGIIHGGYDLNVSGAAGDVDLSFFSSRGGAFPSTGYVGCEIIDSRGASLQYPFLHYPDNGYARIGDISSSAFIFSLGSGRGFLELYDERTGEVSARADLISWVKVDGLRLEELGPGYQSLMADIHVLVIPEPATWLISAAGLWILAALRRIARREPQVNNCCLSNARSSARRTFL